MSFLRAASALCIVVSLVCGSILVPRIANAFQQRASTPTLTAAFKDDFSTLDPALGYDPFSWTGEHAIFDSLLNYANAPGVGGTHLVPDIASAMPKISYSSRWYTIQLRHDVRFAPPVNRLVTATDVRYSIERALAKSTAGPMYKSSFWSPLSGTAAYWAGKSAHIRGIHILNKFAIQFRLDTPDLAFENILALPFGSVVPRERVVAAGKHFADHPVGTGPYRLASWRHGRQMVLVANRNYFRAGLPRTPRVVIQFGVDEHLQVLRAEKGQLDLPGNFVTSTDYLALRNGSFKKQLYGVRDIGVWFLSMNMQTAPFKGNPRLRRAFNMAINKAHIVRLLNGRAIPMNGVLPPTMPGANRNVHFYRYNQSAARQLLQQSGYKPGQLSLNMLYVQGADSDKVADAIQANLSQIGVKVTLQPVSSDTGYNVIYSPGKVPFAMWHWGNDYPDPSDFFDPILTCSASNNAAFYCNHKVDALADRARADTNVTHRYSTYLQMEKQVMADAPWVPLWDDIFYDFHGSRVSNFYVHPVWPFVYDQFRLRR